MKRKTMPHDCDEWVRIMMSGHIMMHDRTEEATRWADWCHYSIIVCKLFSCSHFLPQDKLARPIWWLVEELILSAINNFASSVGNQRGTQSQVVVVPSMSNPHIIIAGEDRNLDLLAIEVVINLSNPIKKIETLIWGIGVVLSKCFSNKLELGNRSIR